MTILTQLTVTNILLLAGIFFLLLAVSGSVRIWNVHVIPWSRGISGILGVGLITLGLIFRSSDTSQHTPMPTNAPTLATPVAFYPSLVDETSWSVAVVEGGMVGTAEPPPWVFHLNKTVNAGNQWSGSWDKIGTETDRISVYIPKFEDHFTVIFLSPQLFKAYKGDDNSLYRIGTRLTATAP